MNRMRLATQFFSPISSTGCWSLGALMFATVLGSAAARAEPPEPLSAGDAALFDRLDADNDGQLSADEVSPGHERLVARLLRRGDEDHDEVLTRDEFLAALVPSRPEKPIEEKLPATFPQADAVRWLLLTLDADGNSRIEANEAPDDMRRLFDAMLERIDANKNGTLERNELSRGAPRLAQIAGRYVRQNGIDVARELAKLEKKLGPAADRFDEPPVSPQDLADPSQAREVFARLDGNGNRQIEQREIPEQLQRPFQRLMRRADRDGDGRLSEREFLVAARQSAQRQARQEAARKAAESTPADE